MKRVILAPLRVFPSVALLASVTFLPVMAHGFSTKPPETRPQPTPAPTPTPAPAPAPTPSPAPTPTPKPPAKMDVFKDVADPVGRSVDSYYSSYRELMVVRGSSDSVNSDTCQAELRNQDRFADRIAYFVNQMMKEQKPEVGSIASLFGAPSSVSSHASVSLKKYPMCNVTAASLSHTIGSNKVPPQVVIDDVNRFVNAYNKHRTGALNGDVQSEIAMNKLWTRFMSCLAYTESLTTADTKTSQNVAAKYAPSGYRKPAGVKFYEDPAQPEVSRLNIGLFQFTPNAGGNVNPCLKSWNKLYPSCAVKENASQGELIRLFGSSYQTFNAFCGTHKLLQTFAIQVNTTRQSATHTANHKGSGTKASGDRCVTPFFRAGWAYNHFGPLQNSTGSNLKTLMTCVLRDLP